MSEQTTIEKISSQSSQGAWPHNALQALSADDLVLLLTPDNKRFVLRLNPGRIHHTHRGQYAHDDMIGQHYGAAVKSQIGHTALLLQPSLTDIMRSARRASQVIYPKDAAQLVHKLSLRAGSRIIEAGTGSGGLTIALAWAVAPIGRVYTYEVREDAFTLAQRNLDRVHLLPYVEMFNRSIVDGFDQENVDALFLDVREPWRYLEHVHAALRPDGFFAALLPTTNQVSQLLATLETSHFVDVQVEELLLRTYKTVPDRLRPEDQMVAHTGYLLFARALNSSIDPDSWLSRDRKRYRARQKAKEQNEAEAKRRAQEIAEGGRKYPRMPLP